MQRCRAYEGRSNSTETLEHEWGGHRYVVKEGVEMLHATNGSESLRYLKRKPLVNLSLFPITHCCIRRGTISVCIS